MRINSKASDGFELFFISAIILFLELAAIRWFPAHVLYLTFFTNIVLLACFLGMSMGCLAAERQRNYLAWTPVLLVVVLAVAHFVEITSESLAKFIDVGHQASPQVVFFGTEYHTQDLSRYAIPIEVLCGFFFLAIALAMIGPGQELGRAMNRLPNRIAAYTLNIVGSIAGILLFAACSWLQLSPLWWFSLVALGLGYFSFLSPRRRFGGLSGLSALTVLLLAAMVWLAAYTPAEKNRGGQPEDLEKMQQLWSPYYRIDFKPSRLSLAVNLIQHQEMVSQNELSLAYALPHLLNRDAGGSAFKDVLIIGAGTGNDVSRALQWGAGHVDAVEIDPAIYDLGRRHHPDRPYQDGRVEIHLDDGRNFLRSADRKYDLVIYALVDSLVLHSGYSNIRLESYLFTRQTFEDVQRHLKPGGTFVIYNFFRQGWLVSRLQKGLEEVFGAGNPLVMTLPYRKAIEPESATFGDFTLFFAGNTGALRNAFSRQPDYWLRSDQAPGPASINGFSERQDGPGWQQFGLANVAPVAGGLRIATDDWPFFYLRKPMIPTLSLRGAVIMAVLALLLLLLFLPRSKQNPPDLKGQKALSLQIFFLGAGFMLIEAKAVVSMALLFGSTWAVNSVVFFAVLMMSLMANGWILKFNPKRLWPYYVGLMTTLALNVLIPLDLFLGMNRSLQVVGSCALVFSPILFAAVLFAAAFRNTSAPDRALGFNIAGAMMGGLAEYGSMVLGFRYVLLVAVLFYALSALSAARSLFPLDPRAQA